MRIPMLFCSAVLACVAGPCSAQSLKPSEVLSSITVTPANRPHPVTGTDNRVHLAYELLIVNPGSLFITLGEVEAVDPDGHSLWSLSGGHLAAMTKRYAGPDGTLPPGGGAFVFMDVSFAAEESMPAEIAARITATRHAADANNQPIPLPADAPFPSGFTFIGARTTVGPPAIAIESPLRGGGWLAVNGCCDSITSHRGAVMAVNGALRIPERFAIDWVQLDGTNRAFNGDPARLTSYPYYGTPVLAVADGIVVNRYDDADEQVPGRPATGITTENIGGNMLVVDIGAGAFAFYAHLQKHSLTVKLGDHVTTGQQLGLLGNTGNSTAPHLHFHVMDGPSPLNANGLPYVFRHFRLRGTLDPAGGDPIEKGEPATIQPGRFAGPHAGHLPLDNQVVDFD
jgi:hypothetical protein